MAQIDINNFESKNKERINIHDKIYSSYSFFEKGNEKYFQIDTYGSSEREIPGKVSQTIQFDKNVARKIVEILRKEYNF